jgi:hypothetical protein
VGSSRAAVCRFCNTLVVRHGQDFEAVGKVADLTPTGTRIALDATGHYLGERFTVKGRLQLEWKQGVWDEWYVSFADGRWGWLAEAGSQYYLTFGAPDESLPARHTLGPGHEIELGKHGRFVVTDVKEARVVSASGELPDEVPLDGVVHSVDLEGPNDTFATIDYGQKGDRPELFLGKELPLDALDVQRGAEAALPEQGPEGEAIVCQNCGAPLTIRVPGQTVRLVCGSCNALLDGKKSVGRVIKVLEKHRQEPPIPIGRQGKLRGADVIVVGWMRRSCEVDHIQYPWDELLIYEPKTTAITWLVCSEGHWSTAKSISAGDVLALGNEAEYKDKRFKRYSSVVGRCDHVLGEFPWKVKVGEVAHLEDYIAPPEGLSVERSGEELNWSHVEHLEAEEVAEAFGKAEGDLPRRYRIGAVQPWPFQELMGSIRTWMIGGVAAAMVLWVIFAMRGQHVIDSHTFAGDDVAQVDPAEAGSSLLPNRLLTYVSEPMQLSGGNAVEVYVKSDVDNSWVWVEGALIREDSGDAAFFGLEAGYYHGYDGGESWSEGSRTASQVLSGPGRGAYIVRADLTWDPAAYNRPNVTVEIREGGWSGGQIVALLSLLLSPLLLFFHRQSFEKRRWEDSNVNG